MQVTVPLALADVEEEADRRDAVVGRRDNAGEPSLIWM
jgi:hypothetical protein